jgi:hypothetical protein
MKQTTENNMARLHLDDLMAEKKVIANEEKPIRFVFSNLDCSIRIGILCHSCLDLRARERFIATDKQSGTIETGVVTLTNYFECTNV